MDITRYNIFKKRIENGEDFLIDFFDKFDMLKLDRFIEKSGWNFVRNDDTRTIIENTILNDNQRYLIVLSTRNNRHNIYRYNYSTLDNRRDIVLSFTDDNDIIMRLLGIYTPTYKPKKIKRII